MSNLRHTTLLALLTLAACGGGIHKRFTFEQAVADPNELVTTRDPAAIRSRLAETELPRTQAHQERILALLQARTEITAAHLALLALSIGHEHGSMLSNDKGHWSWGARGRSDGAAAVERILNDGLPKITTIDRHWYGQLVGLTHSDATLKRYFERFHAGLDDGSPTALFEILDGMPGSPATMPFAVAMRDAGKADDDRCWTMFGHLAFDDDRVAFLRAMLDRGLAVDRDRLFAAMKNGSFDDGRTQMLGLLLQKAPPLSVADTRAVVAMFAFDQGRIAACASLAKATNLQLTENDVAELLQVFAFDQDRVGCVRVMAPHLHGAPTLAGARAVLRAFAFDDDRVAATGLLASRWLDLPQADRLALADAFTFDSGKQRATKLLTK